MPRPLTRGVNLPELPEPSHAFARWSGRAAVGIWALAVQSFEDPLNKLGAILSPGVGYILGHALQAAIDFCANMSSTRRQRIDLDRITEKIDALNKERDEARANGANNTVISLYEERITAAYEERINIRG
jgi:hypothetical protein